MLKGESVFLGPLMAEDLPLLFGWINDRAEVLLNAPYAPVSWESHRAWFERASSARDQAVFGIRLLADKRLIGTCQLLAIHPVHRSAELRVRIGDTSMRNKGLGTQALRLLLTFAFKDLNLNRVHLTVLAGNLRAVRVYEKLGFSREGVERQAAHIDGAWVDLLAMGLLRREYLGG